MCRSASQAERRQTLLGPSQPSNHPNHPSHPHRRCHNVSFWFQRAQKISSSDVEDLPARLGLALTADLHHTTRCPLLHSQEVETRGVGLPRGVSRTRHLSECRGPWIVDCNQVARHSTEADGNDLCSPIQVPTLASRTQWKSTLLVIPFLVPRSVAARFFPWTIIQTSWKRSAHL